tara:strand:- start:29 stop:631 length:603 start_codon:yes stop_codon:yes gene_type:complete
VKKFLLFVPILLILVSCSNESDVNSENLEKNQLQPPKILSKTPTLFCSGQNNHAIIELDLDEMTVKIKWASCAFNLCINNSTFIRGAEHGDYYYSQEKIGDMWFNWSFEQEITKELERYRWDIHTRGVFLLSRKDLSLGVNVSKEAGFGDIAGSGKRSLNCSHETQESLLIKINKEAKKYQKRHEEIIRQQEKLEEENIL